MFTHNLAWAPIGLTAVVVLSINIAVLPATSPSSTAASVAPSTAASVSPETGYRADGTFELDVISAAALTASRRLDAASESAARGQALRAAEQAAAEQHAASHAAEPAPAAADSTLSAPAPTPPPADNLHARAERAADAMPFDWSAHGITFKVGCHPDQSRCAWGTFDYHVDEVWLSSAAFASDARLRGRNWGWQWSTDLDDREADLTDFGVATSDGIEYGADCVAEAWGYPVATYWDCPPDAVAHMRSVFAATT